MVRRGWRVVLFVAVVALLSSWPAAAQVPNVIKFGGVLAGGGAARTVNATFSVYADLNGDAPLWQETQPVAVDAAGRYAVLLGATQSDGLPTALFASGEARWIGVRAEGYDEPSRVALVSVPYALEAGNATTIGGKPLSAFVMAGQSTGVGTDGLIYVDARVLQNGLTAPAGPPSPQGGSGAAGTANYLALFTDATNLANSSIYQTPAGRIGINTTDPAAPFNLAAAETPGAFFDVYSGGGVLGALPVVYRASRGTAATPAAVQTDDILGGLAVRAFNGSAFTGGRGQVMFKAAENWTPTANGTYLAMATEPIGSSAPAVERIRITPDGKVGIGTTAPAYALSVAGTIESRAGGVRFPDGSTQTSAATGLGANVFTATQTISNGNLALPDTSSAVSGVITLGGKTFLHDYPGGNSQNTFLGAWAGGDLTASGPANTGIGAYTLHALTTGTENSALGVAALTVTTTGSRNTAIGVAALGSNTTGADNVSVGFNALHAPAGATANTAVGSRALEADTTGTSNTAVGASSMSLNTVGGNNSAFGTLAMRSGTAGNNNSAFGFNSLFANTASENSAFGANSLAANTTGTGNSAFGYRALTATITAESNSAFGHGALATNSSGSLNAAVGASAMALNDGGTANVAVGAAALSAGSAGSYNVAVGYDALLNASSNYNAAAGANALNDLTTGAYNAAFGYGAGNYITTGDHNTFLGYNARAGSVTPALSYATAIGAGAVVTQDSSLVLGGTGAQIVSVGIGTTAPDDRLQVVGDVRLGTSGTNGCLKNFSGAGIIGNCSSDLRLKTDVQPFGRVLDKVSRLEPVHFAWRASEFPTYRFGDGVNAGLIAQDVERVFPELVQTDEHGYRTVNYTELPLLAIAAVKELKAENDALKAQLAALAERLAKVEKR